MLRSTPSVPAVRSTGDLVPIVGMPRTVDKLVGMSTSAAIGHTVGLQVMLFPTPLKSAAQSLSLNSVVRKPTSDRLRRSTRSGPHRRDSVEGSRDDVSQLIGKTVSRVGWSAEKHRTAQVGLEPCGVDAANASRLDPYRTPDIKLNRYSSSDESMVRHKTGVIDQQIADGQVLVGDDEIQQIVEPGRFTNVLA